MRGHIKYISQRLSLRKPQQEALHSLAQFLDQVGLPCSSSIDWKSISDKFPQMKNFEHDFPSVCFSLATGVGKTRLMGAMLVYLFLTKRVRNFLILAPNNTILDKLVKDFSDPTYSKYVFRGIAEFSTKRPKIITGENFEQGYGVRNDRAIQGDFFSEEGDIHINIFNIAKLHTDKRKIKQINDYLDVSYFDYLASLEDLVILMDEAHQYRAHAAMKTVQELNPLLGLEFTATPQIEKSGGSIDFKNILYNYPLSAALKDEFLKEPAVAGRENFDRKNFATEEELERLKIEDGIVLHEQTKLHLQTYAEEAGVKIVKPLMLIVAQDTKHADDIHKLIEGEEFFNGCYRGKVLVVHSKVKDEAEDKMLRDLLDVENPDNPIEIVIHVDMLREGWDIVNLYTMVPLRKANSKTLIEQNLGRGLRLPYGKRTGKKEVDTHTVVSHDRFNEIVDAANRENSVIRRGIVIGKDVSTKPLEIVEVYSQERLEIEKIEDQEKRGITLKAFEAIHSFNMDSKDDIIDYVKKGVGVKEDSNIESIVAEFFTNHQEKGIYIPRIRVQPRVVQGGRFLPFQLDLSRIAVKPFGEGIIVQGLSTGERTVFATQSSKDSEEDIQNQLIVHLLNFDDVAENEESIEIVRDCTSQILCHLKSYLKEESQVVQVIRQQGAHLAKLIHSQMIAHFQDSVIEWEEAVAEKMIPLRNMRLPYSKENQIKHFTKPVDEKLAIREMVFEGFEKSLYPLVKFDSDSERIFSVIIEHDSEVIKWIKPARGVFSFIHYSKDACYEPDFIVETGDTMYLVEIKRKSEIESTEVISKAKAAAHWCQLASDYAKKNKAKPWTYLLIPHDALHLYMTLGGLAATHVFIPPTGK